MNDEMVKALTGDDDSDGGETFTGEVPKLTGSRRGRRPKVVVDDKEVDLSGEASEEDAGSEPVAVEVAPSADVNRLLRRRVFPSHATVEVYPNRIEIKARDMPVWVQACDVKEEVK